MAPYSGTASTTWPIEVLVSMANMSTTSVYVNTGPVTTAGNYCRKPKPLPKVEAKRLEMHDIRREVLGPRRARWA